MTGEFLGHLGHIACTHSYRQGFPSTEVDKKDACKSENNKAENPNQGDQFIEENDSSSWFVRSIQRFVPPEGSDLKVVSDTMLGSGVIPKAASSVVVPSHTSIPETIANVACKFNLIKNTVKSMFNVFSPFIDMVDSLTLPGDRSEPQENNKKTVKDLTSVLGSIEQEIEKNPDLKKGLSNESKAALDKFYNTVEKLSHREDLKDVDISRLIAEWKRDPNSAVLLQMAQRIRRGECSPFGNAKLGEAFIRSLESLGTALERLENQPQSPGTQQAIQQLQNAANPIVDNVEIHEHSGGDANYTQQDKFIIESNFKESHRRVQGLIRDPHFSSSFSDVSSMLEYYSSFIMNSIHELFMEEKAEEERDERVRCKNLCEERKNDEKLLRENCKKYWIKKSSVNVLSKKLEEMRLNISFHDMLVSRISGRTGVNRTNIESEARKSRLEYNNMEYRYRNEKKLEYYYEDQITEILNEMSPSSECRELMVNTEIEFHC